MKHMVFCCCLIPVMLLVFSLPAGAEVHILSWNVEDLGYALDNEDRESFLTGMAERILDEDVCIVCMTETESAGLTMLTNILNELDEDGWWQNSLVEQRSFEDPYASPWLFDDDVFILFDRARVALRSVQLIENARYNQGLRAPLCCKVVIPEAEMSLNLIVVHAKRLGDDVKTTTAQKHEYFMLGKEAERLLVSDPATPLMLVGDWNNGWYVPGEDGVDIKPFFTQCTYVGPACEPGTPAIDHSELGPDDLVPTPITLREWNSTIDHCVIAGDWPECVVTCCAYEGDPLESFSDHRPIYIDIVTPKDDAWDDIVVANGG